MAEQEGRRKGGKRKGKGKVMTRGKEGENVGGNDHKGIHRIVKGSVDPFNAV